MRVGCLLPLMLLLISCVEYGRIHSSRPIFGLGSGE